MSQRYVKKGEPNSGPSKGPKEGKEPAPKPTRDRVNAAKGDKETIRGKADKAPAAARKPAEGSQNPAAREKGKPEDGSEKRKKSRSRNAKQRKAAKERKDRGEGDTTKSTERGSKRGDGRRQVGRVSSSSVRPPPKPKPQTKLVIRGLPPLLTEEQFLEKLQEHGVRRESFLYFVPGKLSKKRPPTHARAYVHFPRSSEFAEKFIESFKMVEFIDTNSKGSIVYPEVELSAYQKVPRVAIKDPLQGTIDSDPGYQAFLASLQEPVERLPSAEAQLDAKQNDAAEETPVAPLVEFLIKKLEKTIFKNKGRDRAREREKEEKKQRGKSSESGKASRKEPSKSAKEKDKEKIKKEGPGASKIKDQPKPSKKREKETDLRSQAAESSRSEGPRSKDSARESERDKKAGKKGESGKGKHENKPSSAPNTSREKQEPTLKILKPQGVPSAQETIQPKKRQGDNPSAVAQMGRKSAPEQPIKSQNEEKGDKEGKRQEGASKREPREPRGAKPERAVYRPRPVQERSQGGGEKEAKGRTERSTTKKSDEPSESSKKAGRSSPTSRPQGRGQQDDRRASQKAASSKVQKGGGETVERGGMPSGRNTTKGQVYAVKQSSGSSTNG